MELPELLSRSTFAETYFYRDLLLPRDSVLVRPDLLSTRPTFTEPTFIELSVRLLPLHATPQQLLRLEFLWLLVCASTCWHTALANAASSRASPLSAIKPRLQKYLRVRGRKEHAHTWATPALMPMKCLIAYTAAQLNCPCSSL